MINNMHNQLNFKMIYSELTSIAPGDLRSHQATLEAEIKPMGLIGLELIQIVSYNSKFILIWKAYYN